MIRDYLRTLHTKPDHHKKRFSLLVSGCLTLLIFTIWAEVKFGQDTAVIATLPDTTQNTPQVDAASPFASLKASVSEGWNLVSQKLGEAKSGLQSVDVQDTYTEVRNNALSQSPAVNSLNTNGQ